VELEECRDVSEGRFEAGAVSCDDGIAASKNCEALLLQRGGKGYTHCRGPRNEKGLENYLEREEGNASSRWLTDCSKQVGDLVRPSSLADSYESFDITWTATDNEINETNNYLFHTNIGSKGF